MKTVSLFAGLLLSSSFVFAANIAGVDCANFNGNWSGTCTVNSQPQPYKAMYMQSTCDYMTDGNLGTVIGGKTTYSQTTKSVFKALDITENWDSLQKVVTFHTVVHVKRYTDGMRSKFVKDGTLQRDGNKLLEHYTQDEIDNPKDGKAVKSQVTIDCVLQ